MSSIYACHIGFPKTGTTYLQKKYFNKLKSLEFIDSNESREIFDQIIEDDTTIFNETNVKSYFNNLSKNDEPTILFSYETLAGYHQRSGFVNRSLIACRLKELGINRIIITIRNQFDIIESSYRQYIKTGGTIKFKNYFNFIQNTGWFRLEYFDYNKISELYVDLFGIDNVLIIQYEHMFDKSVTDKLKKFLESGIDAESKVSKKVVNESLSYYKISVLRLINHLTYSNHRPSQLISNKISTALFVRLFKLLPEILPNRLFVNERYRNLIYSRFALSNQQLSQRHNIQLDDKYPF